MMENSSTTNDGCVTIYFKSHHEFVEAFTWIIENISEPVTLSDSPVAGGLGVYGSGWKIVKYPNKFYIEDEQMRLLFLLKFGGK